jgi:hypothetical protein
MGYRDKPASTSSNPNSVRCVAILDADAGEDVDSVLLAHPDDDVSVARVRATKGLILAPRSATRTLSGRDATCATLDREDDDDDDGTGGGCVRIGMATLPGTGALLAVETTADEDAVAARLAATTAEHIRFLHGDRWIARLRGERDARDANRRGTEDANGADASTSEQKPSSDDLRSTIESFLFGRNNARTAVRIRCTVDPRVRTALATAETATRPLAERVGSDAAPFFADLKPGAVLHLGTSNEEPCRVLASHVPVDVTARLVAHIGSSKSKGGCTFDARGYHARWVWIQKDPEGSRMPPSSTEEAEKAGGAPSPSLERRGLIAATDGVVVVCTLLRPLVDGLEAASELLSRGGFEVRALEEALRMHPDVDVDDGGWTDDGVDGVASSTEGVDLGGAETMDADAVTTLAEVFEAQRVDRTRAGDAGGGPSFGRD